MYFGRSPIAFESFDPAIHNDPDRCSMWAELRAENPVAWVAPTEGRPGFWVVTKYDDIVAASKSDRFSSGSGNMIGPLLSGGDPAGGKMLVVTDPPRHGPMRRVVQVGFKSSRERIGEALERAADELLRGAVEREEGEWVADVAAHLPLLAVCVLLGVPEEDQPRILELSMASLKEDGIEPTGDAEEARYDALSYFAQLIAHRRQAPRDDLISQMVTAEVEGGDLTDTEVALNCYNILIGGNETGRLSASTGVLALIENPGEWEKLKTGPDSGPESVLVGAVQEILRWTTPATYIGRIASEDTMIRDTPIAAGDVVTLWTVSANRDEEIFDDPYTFDISRKPNRHLTFGRGPHACLGAQIERMGLKSMLRALRAHVSEMELTGPPERLKSTFLQGARKIPVRLTAR
jgi:cytochrome P450